MNRPASWLANTDVITNTTDLSEGRGSCRRVRARYIRDCHVDGALSIGGLVEQGGRSRSGRRRSRETARLRKHTAQSMSMSMIRRSCQSMAKRDGYHVQVARVLRSQHKHYLRELHYNKHIPLKNMKAIYNIYSTHYISCNYNTHSQ